MTPRALKRLGLVATAALCLLGGTRLLDRARRIGEEHHLYSRDAQGAVPPDYILASSLLGGFRSIFMTVLWMRAQELKESGRYYEMVDLYRIISRLQPSHSAAWRFQAWDLAYNVSSRFPESFEDRVFWVFRGLDLLRKEAIPRNRESPELYWELAWFFHHKIGLRLDPAYPDYQRHLWRQVDDALDGAPPERWRVYREVADLRSRFPTRRDVAARSDVAEVLERLGSADEDVDLFRDGTRLLADTPESLRPFLEDPAVRSTVRMVRLWALGERIETKLGMDAREMFELCERFGPINWRAPAAQSLYWATLGERIHRELRPDRPAARYQYLLFHAAIDLPYVNEPPGLSDGGVFSIPDIRFIDPAMDFVEKALERFAELNEEKRKRGETTTDLALMRSIYLGFVSQLAMNAHLDGNEERTRRLLARLESLTGESERYQSAEEFARAELARTVMAMGLEGSIELVDSLYVQALQYLARGDQPAYERQRGRVGLLHSFASARWQSERELPELKDTMRKIVAEVLDGRRRALEGPESRERLAERLRALDPDVLPEDP